MSLTFRKAQPTDAESIAALVNSAYRGEYSKQGWTTEAELLDGSRTDAQEVQQLISQSGSIILLCLQGSKILGSVHIEHAGDHADLGMFVVEPGLQGQGVGKRLLALAEKTAQQEWAATRMVMHVITLRHELIAFYQRRGYRRTGVLKPFPVDPEVWMPKVSGLQLEVLEKDLIDAAKSPE